MVKATSGRAMFSAHDGAYVLKLTGDVRVPMCATLDKFIEGMFENPSLKAVVIDLSETQVIDSTALGLLAKIAIYYDRKFHSKPLLLSPNEDITRILLSMGFPQVFDLRNEGLTSRPAMADVPRVNCSEDNACEKVLEAHRILMAMNENNREIFRDVVQALEEASQKSITPTDCDCATAEKVVSDSLSARSQ